MSFLNAYSLKKNLFEITGQKVILRPPQYSDWKAWADERKKNKLYLQPWEPLWSINELERSSFVKRVRMFERLSHNDQAYSFLIFTSDNEDFIGEVNISNVQRGIIQSCTIGYWIAKDCEGKGMMSESLELVKEFIFNELKLHRIEAACLPHNMPSLKVLLKNGFIKEGTARKLLKINDKWQDHTVLSFILDDFKKLK
ncbi:GNAT family N-acetyltransferase [Pelagibacterales bacterium]|jgi:ribosomal-protein-alanine N-acetyltransferase|nr:GNAT family N-acetyltransferase [Pelagibacteraceae bacterium]MDC3263043.1 GNAT family N-acetyltransferase [Pelagibacterales bacterium]|tara:strand:- start:928 stop:1521 length:594 start_codon:yes stop_codon:yes gene_type:complete